MKKIIIIFIILLLFLSIGRDYYEISSNGGEDLRNRIIGARLLNDNKDPYLYKWKIGDSDKFVDPFDPNIYFVNRVTITPVLLLMLNTISTLNYKNIRFIWFILNYLLLTCILIMFFLINKNKLYSNLLIITLIVSCVSTWFLSIEKGQLYLIYCFFISLSYFLYIRNIKIISGLIIAFNTLIRPNFIFFIFPMFYMYIRKIKYIFKNKLIVSFSASLFIFLVLNSLFLEKTWTSYFKSTLEWSQYHANNNSLIKKRDFDYNLYPREIEGFNISYYLNRNENIKNENISIQKFFIYYLNYNLSTFKLMLIYSLCLLSLLFISNFTKKLDEKSTETLFLICYLSYILNDYFLPVPRYNYNAIQWVFPILLMNSSPLEKNHKVINILLTCSFLLSLPFSTKIPYNLSLAELILFITVIYYIKNKDKVFIK